MPQADPPRELPAALESVDAAATQMDDLLDGFRVDPIGRSVWGLGWSGHVTASANALKLRERAVVFFAT